MAQLDTLTYSSQIIWLVCIFFGFYLCVSIYLFPKVYSSIRVRTFIFEKIWFKSFNRGRFDKIVQYSMYQVLVWLGGVLYRYLWKYQKLFGFSHLLCLNGLWIYLRSKSWVFGVLYRIGCNLVS